MGVSSSVSFAISAPEPRYEHRRPACGVHDAFRAHLGRRRLDDTPALVATEELAKTVLEGCAHQVRFGILRLSHRLLK